MSSRPNIDELFRNELEGQQHEFSEALWQRLDAQLQPERDAYHKKDRKRRAVWIYLLLLAIGGGSTWYIAGNNNGTPQQLAEQQPGHTTTVKPAEAQKEPAPAANPENNTSIAVAPQPNNGEQVTTTAPGKVQNTEAGIPTSTSVQQTNANGISPISSQQEIAATNPVATVKNKKQRTVINKKANEEIAAAIPVQQKRRKSNPAPVASPVTTTTETAKQPEAPMAMPEETVKEEKTTPVTGTTTETITAQQQTAITPTEQKSQPEAQPLAVNKTSKEKEKPARGKTGILVTSGTNLSSPFRKPGVYGGVVFTKTIGDKHIFGGLKIASNRLDHQLVLASKQNQPQAEKDAIIERLTVLQMPFGYEFSVSKKNRPRTTFLQVGFEPAYITGLRTIYFDDRGIPGGPRYEVVNSPIMSKAINRFNISFIAGVRKQVTPRIGISLTGGYSLVDITDKQYYNRTSTNNNLKYIQAGMLFRLNK